MEVLEIHFRDKDKAESLIDLLQGRQYKIGNGVLTVYYGETYKPFNREIFPLDTIEYIVQRDKGC